MNEPDEILGNNPETTSSIRDLSRTALVELVSIGIPIDDAIENIGVPADAISERLMTELRLIETRLEAKLLTTVIEASQDKWAAASWLLERRWPARWAKRQEKGGSSKELPAMIVDVIKNLE